MGVTRRWNSPQFIALSLSKRVADLITFSLPPPTLLKVDG